MGMLVLLAVVLLPTMARAKALTIMWGWFIVPLGMSPLSFGLALGVLYTWSMINGPSWEDVKEHDLGESFTLVVIAVIQVVICLGIGFLVKGAMSIQ